MSTFQILLQAAFFGFFNGVQPGPVLTCSLQQALGKGLRAGLAVIFASAVIFGILATGTFALSGKHFSESFFHGLSALGGIFLMFLSWQIAHQDGAMGTQKAKLNLSIWKVAGLIVFNGGLWLFWISVCLPQAMALQGRIFLGPFWFLLCFEFFWVATGAALLFAFSRFGHFLKRKKVLAKVFKVLAAVLLLFAGQMLWSSFQFFF